MIYDKSKLDSKLIFIYSLSTVVIVFGERFLTGTSYFISQVIAYLVIIYILYADEFINKKIRVALMLVYILMLIVEVASFIS